MDLSGLLRHRADRMGVFVRGDGFAEVDAVVRATGYTRHEIYCVLISSFHSDGGPRFEARKDGNDGTWIRATKKHSLRQLDPRLVRQAPSRDWYTGPWQWDVKKAPAQAQAGSASAPVQELRPQLHQQQQNQLHQQLVSQWAHLEPEQRMLELDGSTGDTLASAVMSLYHNWSSRSSSST